MICVCCRQISAFHILLEEGHLSIDDQQTALRNIHEAYADLQRSFDESREDYEFLWRQEAVTAGGTEADATREMEAELFQLEMKLDRLEHEVTENAKMLRPQLQAEPATRNDNVAVDREVNGNNHKSNNKSGNKPSQQQQQAKQPATPNLNQTQTLSGDARLRDVAKQSHQGQMDGQKERMESPKVGQLSQGQQQIVAGQGKKAKTVEGQNITQQQVPSAGKSSKPSPREDNSNVNVAKSGMIESHVTSPSQSGGGKENVVPSSIEKVEKSKSASKTQAPVVKDDVKSNGARETGGSKPAAGGGRVMRGQDGGMLDIEQLLDRQYDDLMDEYRKLKYQKPSADKDAQMKMVLAVSC